MNRFFYHTAQREADIVRLQGDDVQHLTRVLRAAVGSQIELCDEECCHRPHYEDQTGRSPLS